MLRTQTGHHLAEPPLQLLVVAGNGPEHRDAAALVAELGLEPHVAVAAREVLRRLSRT